MAKRIEPSRKSPLERLEDLLRGHDEAAYGGPASALKYLERALGSSDSMPNAVKFFAHALVVDAAAGLGTAEGDDRALAALEAAEGYLAVAREELARETAKRLPDLRFLERGVALRSDRAEWDEALRLCDLALGLGYGKAFEAKKRSIERMAG